MTAVHRVVAATAICVVALCPQGHANENPRNPVTAPAVIAIAGNARVRLAWTAVDGAVGYRIFRSTNGVWEPKPIARTANTSYMSEGLENGISYSFTVAAYASDGDGPLSLAVTVTPLAPPADVTATPGDRRVTLKWIPSAGASSYAIYRRMSTDADYQELATGVVAPTFVDTGLTNGRRYYYQVRAVAGQTESEPSERASAVASPASGLRD